MGHGRSLWDVEGDRVVVAVRGAIARQLRNRVSDFNLGVDAKIITETRFLGMCRSGGVTLGVEKPGF